jgi:hypothetical protein
VSKTIGNFVISTPDSRRLQQLKRDSVRAAAGGCKSACSETRMVMIAAAVIVLACFAAALYFRAAPKLTDKDTIVLAVSPTRPDTVVDGTLCHELAIELGKSPFLSLISEERNKKVLPLMGKPKDAPLTPEVAREICERTGSAAVVDGSIARLGSQYVLSLRAKNCRTGTCSTKSRCNQQKEDV